MQYVFHIVLENQLNDNEDSLKGKNTVCDRYVAR